MKIKNVNDYVDKVHELFPEIPESEIKRILVYGFKMVLLYVRAGNDLLIKNKNFWMFIGQLPKTGLQAFEKYKKKLARRIAFMFQRTKSEWDGYYYFSRTENQYIEYAKLNRRKYKIFKDVFLYKLLEEVKVFNAGCPYIFRLRKDEINSMHKYYPELKTDLAELIIQRDPLKMLDIMTSQNKFKYILL